MDSGFRPTSLLLGLQPHSKWRARDFLIFEAVKIYEAERSDSHGNATYITKSGDANLRVMVRERTDVADEALQEYDDKNNKKKKPARGIVRWVDMVYVDPETGKLGPVPRGGLAREHYYKLAQEQTNLETAGMLNDSLDIDTDKPTGGYNPADYGDGV